MAVPKDVLRWIRAYPAETTEAFCDGHVSALSFLGGVPRSILYDNTTLAVAKILGDGRRRRTRVFSELVSHYLFEDRFSRPGKGNDKGKVEGLVGYARRNFLVPVPSFESFDALNAYLAERWGRMAIVDTKPFKLRVILHRIFVERPQVTGIPAWPGGAACYRRSRYIL